MILLTEEALLEALCFDFVVEGPHALLVDLYESHQSELRVQDLAWSIAHDSLVHNIHSTPSANTNGFVKTQIPVPAVPPVPTKDNRSRLRYSCPARGRRPEFSIS